MSVALTSALGVAVPFGLGFVCAALMPGLLGYGAHQEKLLFALFMGAALSISALPVIARILMNLDLLRREIGAVVITAATANDVFGWAIFAVVLSLSGVAGSHTGCWRAVGATLGVSGVIWGLGRWACWPLLRWARPLVAWPSGLIAAITVFTLAAAVFPERCGVHGVFGAFLLGIALSRGLQLEENGRVRRGHGWEE